MKRALVCAAAVITAFCLPLVSYGASGGDGQEAGDIEKKAVLLYQGLKQAGGDWAASEGFSEAEVREAYQFMTREILNSNVPKIFYRMDASGNVKAVRLEDGARILDQHEAAEAYVENIWKTHKDSIEGITGEKERADHIAKILVENYICAYDYSLGVKSIYDLSSMGSKKGTCNVFTTLFDRICEKAGINGYMEIGKLKKNLSASHGWNRLVFEDGTAHYYDLTLYMSLSDPSYLDMTAERYKSEYQREE